jgi:molecular chaperone GrpE (heat shock protein)
MDNQSPETSNISEKIDKVIEKLGQNDGQNALLLQQIIDLSSLVYTQGDRLNQLESKIFNEFKLIRTGSAQQAMVSVFQKFFRDLIKIINNLDDLLVEHPEHQYSEDGKAWIKSIKILQIQFEETLKDWGCVPVEVKSGSELFDPEIHEAVGTDENSEFADLPENTIVKIHRRGWKIQNQVIQYPQVLTNKK